MKLQRKIPPQCGGNVCKADKGGRCLLGFIAANDRGPQAESQVPSLAPVERDYLKE